MAGPAVALQIIFGDETDSRKLPLMSGIPAIVEELHALIKTLFQLKEEFRLQYMDVDFKEFMNLTSVSEIEQKQKHTEGNMLACCVTCGAPDR